ncbi:MAG: hypothetical protein WC604_05255 [Candidatus Gracilibacteria bacterium]
MKKVHYFATSAIFFGLFLMYSVGVVIVNCGSGCDPDGTYFNLGVFPKDSFLTSPMDWLNVIVVVLGGS